MKTEWCSPAGSDLDLVGALLGRTVTVVFLLTLHEFPEVVLDQEGGVELPHRDLIIWGRNTTWCHCWNSLMCFCFCSKVQNNCMNSSRSHVVVFTSDGRYDLVEQFHTGAFPDLLYDGSQLLVGLLKVTWQRQEGAKWYSTSSYQPKSNVCVSSFQKAAPSVLILRAVLTRANRVALKVTVPSLLRGMFMEISLLQAARWGQNFPKPSGGWILRSRVTTSRCLIRPLQVEYNRTQIEWSSNWMEMNLLSCNFYKLE